MSWDRSSWEEEEDGIKGYDDEYLGMGGVLLLDRL